MRAVVLFLAALGGCHPNDDGPPPADTETDADTDADADTDVDTDTTDTDTGHTGDTDTRLGLGDVCEPDVSDCGEGNGCCTACCETGALPVCTALDATGGCPLPDLTVDAAVLAESVFLTEESFDDESCALEDGCVTDTGWRRLLRFTTMTPNIGTGDLTLGMPSKDTERFDWSECHSHYHLEGYIEYALLDATGSTLAVGRKQAFCLMDSEPYGGGKGIPKYHCGDQGISAGWADTYSAWLDCQWLDVTEVPPGDYTLRLSLDPDGMLRELDTSNNVVEVDVTVPSETDVLADCDPVAYGESRDCGWIEAGTFSCTPGAEVTVGCDAACDGGCDGDPVLRVCDAANPDCTSSTALGSNDDAPCGSACSELTVTCPDGGEVQALSGAWASDESAICEVVAG